MLNTLKTPALNILGEIKAKQLLESGEKSLEDNWENIERHPNDPHCIIKYGVDKGDIYGQVIQTNIDEYIELARLKREAEIDNPKNHDNNPFLPTFGLPCAVRMELEARGFPIQDMIEAGDFTDIHNIIEKEYPYLKWTNVLLKKNK